MKITKSNVPDKDTHVKTGDTITYSITAKNTGIIPLNNVGIKDYIPENTSYVPESISENGDYHKTSGSEKVQWLISEIGVGKEKAVSFTVKVNDDIPSATVIRNTALGEILGNDKDYDKSGDPAIGSNEVTNNTPSIDPETILPDVPEVNGGDGGVLGEFREATDVNDKEVKGDEDQSVLGEDANTADTMNSSSFLIILLIGAVVVMVITFRKMSKK